MRIKQIQLMHVRIPLRKRVRHASHVRESTDSILVSCRLDDGSIGWGEGVPRPYVTGETIDTAWQHLHELKRDGLAANFDDAEELRHLVSSVEIPRTTGMRDCFGNAARCALELAILDAGCRSLNIPVSDWIKQLSEAQKLRHDVHEMQYSAVITATKAFKVRLRCWMFRYYGFRQCKVKVGVPGQDDLRLLKIVRGIWGSQASIRIDANEAWDATVAGAKIAALERFRLESCEQPVAHPQVRWLNNIRRQCSVPIMLDESLCSRSDAHLAVDEQLCDAFNLRLSKCGGILPTAELALIAHEAGLSSQLGCQVGETGILSAAGRHFAAAISGLTALEGSFDRFLVRERLTVEDITFGRQGKAPALTGPGWGVTVDQLAVQRVTQRSTAFEVS